MQTSWKEMFGVYALVFFIACGMAWATHVKEQSIYEKGKAAGKAELREELNGRPVSP